MSFRESLYPIALHTLHSDYHFSKLPLPPFALLPRYANTAYMCVIDPSLVSILDRFGVLLLPPWCSPPVPKWWLTLVTPCNHMHKLCLKETEWTIEWLTQCEVMRFQLFADSVGEYKQLEEDDLHHLTGWGTTTASSPRQLDNKHNQNRHAGRKPIPWFPRKTQLQSAVCSVQASETSLRSVDLQHPHAPGVVHAPTPGEDEYADDLCCWSSLEPPAASATLFPVAREPPCRPSFRSFPRCLKWLFRMTRTASRSSSPGPYGKQRTLSTIITSRDSRLFPLNPQWL